MPVVDLFCGCGGLSTGFEQAGFDIVAAFDGWDSAITCYNANFEHEAIKLDLSDVDGAVAAITRFNPMVIIGGPPCQEFSNAGKREEGDRADLTYKYAEIITRILPAYFVMENVPRAKQSNAYARARELYVNHNYGLTEVVLDASRLGVPQKRSRFFCVGALNAPDNFLLESILSLYDEEETSVREYFDDNDIPLDIDDYYRHPTTYSRRAIFSVDSASPTIRGVNRPKPGTYHRHENDSVGEDELGNIRALTLRERASIQTFPENYVFENLGITNGDLEQMVGNAVPVRLAQFVAERLINYMEQRENNQQLIDEQHTFSWWLRNVKQYESDRSIGDVFSRIRRAQRILPSEDINRYYLADLEDNEEFLELNVSIRSQIRKAIRLKIAFDTWAENHD
ncbi:MAG: DNA cytosine methyltransferase [Clostridia bacterium]|nr:DNA cytosine methyltransferase [Clostridia bacterium]